jgi:hypothetical protein
MVMWIASVAVAAIGVAPAPPDKPAVLDQWTRPTAASYRAWNAARQHPAQWAAYGFVWDTDDCTMGPDRPAGFDFRLPCRRHDFGYRNYLAAGTLAANRGRLDRALYADLRRQCGTYRALVRPVCSALAWTYYRAADAFGTDVPLGGGLHRR